MLSEVMKFKIFQRNILNCVYIRELVFNNGKAKYVSIRTSVSSDHKSVMFPCDILLQLYI